VGLGDPAKEEVGDPASVGRMDPEGPRGQGDPEVEDQATEEVDDPASVGRMDPEGPRGQGDPEVENQAAEGPGSEAKAVEALGLMDRVAEALEVAGRNERRPAKVCP